eukprot:TRINITY_DN31307_c0_g1_i1.p1 TRINITY_DN31307_c0_g1~~TRINITY_DN31307_c0_g1_i1.p1  ORF type:complete len:270 (+),score=52.37 TRINITY_DN31307_c0_g1_i1:71-811(+)
MSGPSAADAAGLAPAVASNVMQQPVPLHAQQQGAQQPSIDHRRARQVILAAVRQRGNPILSQIRSTLVEFIDGLAPDYLAGPEIAVLFISLKFHRLHPEYLSRRIQALTSTKHRSRVLLCRVDVEQPDEPLEQITLQAFHAGVSLVLAWTDAEAAAYLETLHRHQNKSAEALMAKLPEDDQRARFSDVLTTVKGVNRTDASIILQRFGSFTQLASATEEELQRCPGIGEKKVKQLHHVFHTPFYPC